MKKIKTFFIIIIFLFLVTVPKVNAAFHNYSLTDADRYIYIDKVNSREYLALCSYLHTENHVSADNRPYSYVERINIYYMYDNKWLVTWDKPAGSVFLYQGEHIDKSGTADKVFSKDSNIFISESDKDNLINKGACPTLAWVDMGGGFNELCFGDESYCSKQNNIGTHFAKASGKETYESAKNYDINDPIKKYFEDYTPTYTCEILKNKECDFKSKLTTDFINNFMNSKLENNIPDFIINNDTYLTGMDDMKTRYELFKQACINEVNEDETKTEEEKQEEISQIEEGYQECLGEIEDFEEDVEEKEEVIDGVDGIQVSETTCTALFSGQFGILLGRAFNLIRFAVPILIIGLSILDYIKAIAAQKQDEIIKSTQKLAKRLIIGVAIFLLPTLIEFILGLAGYGINDGHCFDWLKYS